MGDLQSAPPWEEVEPSVRFRHGFGARRSPRV